MPAYDNPMERSWLIQRLDPPQSPTVFGKDNPFNFGGGLLNGGLSPGAMDLFRPIFSFDYMGSAEFEFGAVPKAFQGMAESEKDLVAYRMTVPLSEVPQSYRQRKDKEPKRTGDAPIFVLCRTGHRAEVTDRITAMARGEERLKDGSMLTQVLNPDSTWTPRTQGWFEIDNGYLFFTDETMWSQVCGLFGVST